LFKIFSPIFFSSELPVKFTICCMSTFIALIDILILKVIAQYSSGQKESSLREKYLFKKIFN
jgi:hypothetical protein